MRHESGALRPGVPTSNQAREHSETAGLGRYHQSRRILIAFAIVFAFVVTGVVRSSWSHGVHEMIEAAGLFLIASGILGRMWSVLYIGSRKSKELIAFGPYSVTRNPLYLFSTISMAGVGAQSGSLVVTAVFAALSAAVFHLVILAEERFLAEVFGKPYAAYLKAVPRFFPDVRLFRDDAFLTVKTSILYRTFKDGVLFFVAIPVLEGIEHLQDLHILPVLLHLP